MLSPQGWCEMVDVGGSSAQGGLADGGMLHEIVLLIHHGFCPTDEQNRKPVVQLTHLVRGQQLFATLSSDEFKKTAAAKKNLCGCRSNWRLEAKKSPVVPGK